VKITLIGRSDRIVEKEVAVLTLMRANASSLPKGLPPVSTEPTAYIMFIA
jgi:hypothetical protein